MIKKFMTTLSLICGLSTHIVVGAETPQQAPDIMIVFDASGSMWGQIDGRAKIEIARDTLSSVLSEATSDMQIGMIAYGHRKKGQCNDIQTIVPLGAANQTVPAIIAAANAIKPKGKTPLSDAVRIAAEELKYTENAATVILVTDGIETCNADPCALANELESLGVDFTAHVVGFGLSKKEGQQVACLAENTGGTYYPANNADELAKALAETIAFEPNDMDFVDDEANGDFVDDEPISTTSNVKFIFRDTQDEPILTAREVEISFENTMPEKDSFSIHYNSDYTASGVFKAGDYTAIIKRNGRAGYQARYNFTIKQGEATQIIQATLGGHLRIKVMINKNTPFDYKNPPIAAVKKTAWVYFDIFPIIDGKPAEKPVISTPLEISEPLTAGEYLLRGTIDRTTTIERHIEILAGTPTNLTVDFKVTKVYFDARQTDGSPVKRQTTYLYDKLPSGRNHWRSGYGRGDDGQSVRPFYLPTGQWIIDVGGEGYGERRSQILVTVPGDSQDINIKVGEGERLSDPQKAMINSPSYQPCLAYIGAEHIGCLADSSPKKSAQMQNNNPANQNNLTAQKSWPIGIFAMIEATPQDANFINQGAQQCALTPAIFYPDQTILRKKIGMPIDGNPYSIVSHANCYIDGTTQKLFCEFADGQPSQPQGTPISIPVTIKPLSDGHYSSCASDGGPPCQTIFACVRPNGELDASTSLPNRTRVVDAIIKRPDSGPIFTYSNQNLLQLAP